jgi:tRNA1(Val) A37 N6-methylase TrmN6
MNRETIYKSLIKYDIEVIKKDYNKLCNVDVSNNLLHRIDGNKVVHYYMKSYELDTKCNSRYKNFNFYMFINNPEEYLSQNSYNCLIRILTNIINENYRIYKTYIFYNTYIFHFSIFKPLIAKYLYQIYKPTSILDFSMGWGGRLVGAMSIPNIKYIGYDTNINLQEPYNKMINDFEWNNRTSLYFEDSSTADFSIHNYDMVFTSPPYYDLEIYSNMPVYNSFEEWINRFLKPVITNSYRYLKNGGYFCINVNKICYEEIIKILGKETTIISIHNNTNHIHNIKKSMKKGNIYTDKIFVWYKV